MATWSKETLLEFIRHYRRHECLWKIKSRDYSNRLLKEKAYQQMVDFCKTVDSSFDKSEVTKKINNLRGCFRKELKKMDASKLSGAGSDEVR